MKPFKSDTNLASISLDLEPDHAGRIPESYFGWKKNRISPLLGLLNKYRIPLDIFVTGQSLNQNPGAISYFASRNNCSFHLHSYSHSLRKPDSAEEINKGIKEFKKVFGKKPLGYRAPQGGISQAGLLNLKKRGFLFDSSVFPSFWPHPKYLFYPTCIYQPFKGFFEIPITTISPLRIIFSLSWVKLIGWNQFLFLSDKFGLPQKVIFEFHLHDLWLLSSASKLPLFWRKIYLRNSKDGFKSLENVLMFLSKRRYKFVSITSLLPNTNKP